MGTSEAEGFETVVERSALWLRVGWISKACVASVLGLLFGIGAIGGVIELVSPPPERLPNMPWQATLVAAAIAALLLRAGARAARARSSTYSPTPRS